MADRRAKKEAVDQAAFERLGLYTSTEGMEGTSSADPDEWVSASTVLRRHERDFFDELVDKLGNKATRSKLIRLACLQFKERVEAGDDVIPMRQTQEVDLP